MVGRNTLWFGDNLEILRRHVRDESVDLIYLDPPFNSNRNYNVLFKERSGADSEAQIQAFEDTWTWDLAAERAYDELITECDDDLGRMVVALRDLLGTNDMLAYLVNMGVRLVELHRVLKQTGSLYLHCDPTASHYLKILLDGIFGPKRFRNEIIWKRTTAHSSAKKYAPIHDTILYYGKSDKVVWNAPRTGYDESYLDRYYRFDDGDGRLYWRDNLCAAGVRNGRSGLPWRGIDPTAKGMHWKFTIDRLDELDAEGRIYWPAKGTMPQYKRYRDELKGLAVPDIWDDIDRINPVGKERLGYPTQKPEALLERIIAASSNPGDVVLDPFCGCGTATVAAEKLGRRWLGIDVTYLAIKLVENRLHDALPGIEFDIRGVPTDIEGARALAMQDPFSFQYWSLGLVDARPSDGKERKGADRGVDGVVLFSDGPDSRPKRVVVSVKGGDRFTSSALRDLHGTMHRERAELGLLLTLKAPTREMLREAREAGVYRSEHWGREYPRIQIATIEDLLAGRYPSLPPSRRTFARAERQGGQARQPGLGGL